MTDSFRIYKRILQLVVCFGIKYSKSVALSVPVPSPSFASLILTSRRGLLSDENFEMLLVLKACLAFKKREEEESAKRRRTEGGASAEVRP